MIPPSYTSLPDSFWSQVDSSEENACWIWTGYVNRDGYGLFFYNGKTQRVHRLAITDAKGPIPPGILALHTCDIRCCVIPAHLYCGTQHENMQDMVQRGQQFKLTSEMVTEARQLFIEGFHNIEEIAVRYGVHRGTITRAIYGLSWGHVPQVGIWRISTTGELSHK